MNIVAHAIDILPCTAARSVYALEFDYTLAITGQRAYAISLDYTQRADNRKLGYIAGTADGLVTVAGQPASREILLMDANSAYYKICARAWSMDNGHYIFTDLDPNAEYLVLSRDYKREYEPVAYDYVKPATDLTVAEQNELWRSWQT